MSSTQQPTDSTDNNQPKPTAQNSGITRRDLLRRSAVGGATLAGVSTGAIRLDHGPVQEAEAIPPVIAAGVAGAGTGWLLREQEIIGSDTPPEGLTEDALYNESYNTLQDRRSTNGDTFTDNKNIVENIEDTAYADAKIDAIDALNEQKSESEVLEAANEAINDYEITLLENLFGTWNETLRQISAISGRISDHEDASESNFWGQDGDWYVNTGSGQRSINGVRNIEYDEKTYETEGGTELEYYEHTATYEYSQSGTTTQTYNLVTGSTVSIDNHDFSNPRTIVNPSDRGAFDILVMSDWRDIFNTIVDTIQDVRDEIGTFVSTIYSDVQAGELDTSELLTPREKAQLTTEDEDFPQALADLRALNVGVDSEREAEVFLENTGAILYGTIAYSGDSSLEAQEYDPNETDDEDSSYLDGSVYLTYDVSEGQGEWDAVDDGVDGGDVTFTEEPFEETLYQIETTAGESATVSKDDFSESDDEWIVDISDQVNDAITEVDQVSFFAESDQTNYETIILNEPFEIRSFTDSEGETYDEAEFERSETHTAENYITEEEWQEREENYEELIQQYEDSQGGITIPGVDDVLSGEANGLIGIAVVGLVLVFGILSALNPLS